MIGIYIRVSSMTQVNDGYSLSAQKERLSAFCKAQGWESFKFYVEEGLSGKNTKRPIYQKLMQHVKEAKINTVLVYKLDRIMRSIGELDKMLKVFEDYNCGFKSATEPFDTTNPTGKLFMYIVGAFAQWEIDVSSERISMVLEEKVANEGIWIGNVPYPYDLCDKNKKLKINKERTQKTLDIINKYKSGESTEKIANHMNENESTSKTWRANTVLRILRNPALCGDTRWLDKVYKDTHKGLISRTEFDKLQVMVNDRSITRLRDVKSTYLFQNILLCPVCKDKMSVNRYFRKRVDGSKYQGATYRCPGCAKNNDFNYAIGEPRLLKAFKKYMSDVIFKEIKLPKIEDDLQKTQNDLLAIENKRSRYQRAWASEIITDDEFMDRMKETKETYEDLKSKVSNYNPPNQIDVDQVKKIINTFNKNFEVLTKSEKRSFLATFVRSIEFVTIDQPPLRPDKNARGQYLIEVTGVSFY